MAGSSEESPVHATAEAVEEKNARGSGNGGLETRQIEGRNIQPALAEIATRKSCLWRNLGCKIHDFGVCAGGSVSGKSTVRGAWSDSGIAGASFNSISVQAK